MAIAADFDLWRAITTSIVALAALYASARVLWSMWLDRKADRLAGKPSHDRGAVEELRLAAESYRKLAGIRSPVLLAFLFFILLARTVLAFAP